ncbi:ABC transporter permease [Lapidilactobacillus salsurivasis]
MGKKTMPTSQRRLQRQLLKRRIQTNWGRFVAIILIMMLGVLLYVGIKSSGPVLYNNAQTYFTNKQASDLQIISTTGLTETDVKLAEKLTGAKVEAGKSVDALTASNHRTVHLMSLPQDLNQLQVLAGRRPTKANEIILDEQAQRAGYRLGQTYKFQQTSGLARQQFRIVGFARSPLFIDRTARGTTTIGAGTVDYFACVTAQNFSNQVYSVLYLQVASLTKLNPFQDTYQDKSTQATKRLKKIFKGRAAQRNAALFALIKAKLAKQQDQLTASQQQVTSAQAQLTAQQQQLDQQLAASDQLSASQQATLAAQQAALKTQQTQLTAQAQQLTAAATKLQQARQQAKAQINTQYYFNDRQALPGYSSYGELAERIQAIANVFPLIFFLIAILVTFTTMTRMIEEDRLQIGTMKALGYTRREIGRGYLTYALLAALCGSVAGVIIGTETLPRIIFKMMQNQFSLPDHGVLYIPSTIAIASLLAAFATLGAVGIAISRELRERPAALLLPRAPKAGKEILLEKIKPLWRHLSFNRKVSYRNLFRFKSRMWMGILGIAGGTGLILAGFGIRDSIAASSERQFSEIIHYQAVVTTTKTSAPKAAQVLAADSRYQSKLPVHAEQVNLRAAGQQVDAVTLYAAAQPAKFQRYMALTGPLPDKNGVILSAKTAQLLELTVGDQFTVQASDGVRFQAKLRGVTTNYAGHFIYFSRGYLHQVAADRDQINTWLVRTKSATSAQEQDLAQQLLATKQVVNVSYLSTQQAAADRQTQMLQLIVVIFILLSGLLTFIVLYNLTNINVSERIRELSTIKVLGFYDREVTMYIVRENLILTILGIILGLGFGNLLTLFILHQAATSQVVFPLTISFLGYAVAITMTILFTIIVMFVTHRHLKAIDMIAALKAND